MVLIVIITLVITRAYLEEESLTDKQVNLLKED